MRYRSALPATGGSWRLPTSAQESSKHMAMGNNSMLIPSCSQRSQQIANWQLRAGVRFAKHAGDEQLPPAPRCPRTTLPDCRTRTRRCIADHSTPQHQTRVLGVLNRRRGGGGGGGGGGVGGAGAIKAPPAPALCLSLAVPRYRPYSLFLFLFLFLSLSPPPGAVYIARPDISWN
jgi:hypothetical protein